MQENKSRVFWGLEEKMKQAGGEGFWISIVWNYLIAQRNKYRMKVKKECQITHLERAEHPSGQVSCS